MDNDETFSTMMTLYNYFFTCRYSLDVWTDNDRRGHFLQLPSYSISFSFSFNTQLTYNAFDIFCVVSVFVCVDYLLGNSTSI